MSKIPNWSQDPNRRGEAWEHDILAASVTIQPVEDEYYREEEGYKYEFVAAMHETFSEAGEYRIGRENGSGSVMIDSQMCKTKEDARDAARDWMRDNPNPTEEATDLDRGGLKHWTRVKKKGSYQEWKNNNTGAVLKISETPMTDQDGMEYRIKFPDEGREQIQQQFLDPREVKQKARDFMENHPEPEFEDFY